MVSEALVASLVLVMGAMAGQKKAAGSKQKTTEKPVAT